MSQLCDEKGKLSAFGAQRLCTHAPGYDKPMSQAIDISTIFYSFQRARTIIVPPIRFHVLIPRRPDGKSPPEPAT
jgi:hypothetical protein